MKTSKSFQQKRTFPNLIIYLFCFILFSGCSKDDDSTDNTPNHFGTYTLTSISSNFLLDSNADGEFNDDQLIDNLSCSSSIVLNADNSFTWDVLNIRQDSSGFIVISSYEPIRCFITENITGQFVVDDIEITFDSSAINNVTTSINETSIEILIRPELIISEGILPQKEQVNLTLTYER
tara:strand:+ start:995 stop:1531 length:537 start_codon:yes stop_codon:yes gene_type:complete